MFLKIACFVKVKEFHPDVYKGARNSDEIILRVIGAYEVILYIYLGTLFLE